MRLLWRAMLSLAGGAAYTIGYIVGMARIIRRTSEPRMLRSILLATQSFLMIRVLLPLLRKIRHQANIEVLVRCRLCGAEMLSSRFTDHMRIVHGFSVNSTEEKD